MMLHQDNAVHNDIYNRLSKDFKYSYSFHKIKLNVIFASCLSTN